MLKLVIDIGNTLVKCALFEQDALLDVLAVPQLQAQDLAALLQGRGLPQCAIVSNVRSEAALKACLALVQPAVATTMVMDVATPTPLTNLYKTPQTLGFDRLAAAVGAHFLYPCRNVLVVNAGTALTYEVVSERGEYVGGNISPGLRCRYAALHQFTQKLPLCEPTLNPPLLGQTSQDAITAGVQQGMLREIEATIDYFASQYTCLQTILTGGEAIYFENQLKSAIFAAPYLVLIGLNKILDDAHLAK
ncbi:type III pantothenate kinase [Bacteroidia bacterium]|nr:type III pantothenate kinase [Bacteroidia bacterium]